MDATHQVSAPFPPQLVHSMTQIFWSPLVSENAMRIFFWHDNCLWLRKQKNIFPQIIIDI